MKHLTRFHRGGLVAGLTLLVAALALAPGQWSTALAQTAAVPPPPPPAVVTVTVVVDNTTTTIVTTPNNLASITIPPGSQITSIELTVTTSPTDPGANVSAAISAVTDFVAEQGALVESITGTVTGGTGGQVELGYVFEISFGAQASGTDAVRTQLVMNVVDGAALHLLQEPDALQVGATELAVAATATLNVLPETLAQVGGDLGRLVVVFVDPANNIIEPVTMLPSPGPGVLAFEFTKEGAYAVLVLPVVQVAEAPPLAPQPSDTGTGLALAGGGQQLLPLLGLLALAAAGAFGARRYLRR